MAGAHQTDRRELQTQENEKARFIKTENNFGVVGMVSFLIAVALFAILKFADIQDGSTTAKILAISLGISMIGVLVGIIGANVAKSNREAIEQVQSKKDAEKLVSIQDIAKAKYREQAKELAMPAKPFYYENKCLWIANKTLYMMDTEGAYLSKFTPSDSQRTVQNKPIRLTSLPVDKIQYYTKEGDIQYTSKVSGGGGGGSSIGGAVVGGLIAGDAGAIIGSRKKVEAIRTETETHDTRCTVLRYYAGNTIKSISFAGFEFYDYLLQHIPEKDYSTMQLQRQESPSIPAGPSRDAKSRLQSLKELYDSGLLDADEYKAKRDSILQDL